MVLTSPHFDADYPDKRGVRTRYDGKSVPAKVSKHNGWMLNDAGWTDTEGVVSPTGNSQEGRTLLSFSLNLIVPAA